MSVSTQTDDAFQEDETRVKLKFKDALENESFYLWKETATKLEALSSEECARRWKRAIDGDDTDEIVRLTKRSIIPNKHLLNHVCYKFGHESSLFNRICTQVCSFISDYNENVASVVPTYKIFSPFKIVFLVYLRKPSCAFDIKEFDLVFRNLDVYSEEGKEVHKMEVRNKCFFTESKLKNVTTVIENNSEFLFKKHNNLQMISPSFYKSSNYGRANETIENELCIALYVSVKGFIPLFEEELPSKIENIPTDVREGGFEFLSNADDWHTNLKMGCEIAGSMNLNGTLGPFFKEGGHTYCLTAAHVLFDHNMIPRGTDLFEWPSTKSQNYNRQLVFQPNPSRNPNWQQKHFGEVYRAFYKRGNRTLPGMEIAVIEITDLDRKPISGEFPDFHDRMNDDSKGEEETPDLLYETGEIAEKDLVDNGHGVEVIKFGAVSGQTRGRLRFPRSSFRRCVCTGTGDIMLYNQIEVSPLEEGGVFAQHGDSGAVVLAYFPDQTNDHLAVGLLTGRASTGMALFTPMYAILDELGLTERRLMKFDNLASSQTSRQKARLDATNINLPTDVLDKLDSIDQALSQEVAKHTSFLKSKMDESMKANFDNFKQAYFNPEIEAVKQSVKDLNSTVQSFQNKLHTVDQTFSQELTKHTEHLNSHMEKKMNEKFEKIENLTQNFPEMMNMVKQILENQNKT